MSEKNSNEKKFNKKIRKVGGIIACLIAVAVFCIPVGLCIKLSMNIGELNDESERLLSDRSVDKSTNVSIFTTEEDTSFFALSERDRSAYEKIEKDTNEANALFAYASENDSTGSNAENDSLLQSDNNDGTGSGDSAISGKEPVSTPTDGEKETEKVVYLTFDDGPTANTSEILDILDEEGIKATFFVCDTGAANYDGMKEIVKRGHTIGMHSLSHEYDIVYADLDSFKNDVEGIHDLILKETGVDTKYYRFPGGSSNQVSNVSMYECIGYLNSKGYTYYDWNALNEDASEVDYTPDELIENVLYYVSMNEGDSMVLMHDNPDHENTIRSLKALIKKLKEMGYTFKAIDDDAPLVQHVSY